MHDIITWIKKVCDKYSLKCIYVPDVNNGPLRNDFFSITTKQGHVVMNFTTRVFYDLPPRVRERQLLPSIKRGLNQIVGEKTIKRDQRSIIRRRYGKQIA